MKLIKGIIASSLGLIFGFSSIVNATNEILGDFNGDGNLDAFNQAINIGETSSLTAKAGGSISGFHVSWTSTHPDIAAIPDWSARSYGAYSSNLTSSPGDELLLLGRREIILLHGDIITPILIPKVVKNAVVSWDSAGNATYKSFDLDVDPDDVVVQFADLDGDGYLEIVLQGKSQGSPLYIVNGDGSIRQTMTNGYLGVDWSAAAYDIVIKDINNDGRADFHLVSKIAGVADKFVYSNASGIINTIGEAYHLDDDPKVATLVGSTGGEFKVSESGSATYSLPINVPAGTAGVTPSISLNYSSTGGNGPLGIGWSISGLSSVSRCAENIAQNNDSITAIMNTSADRFCLDGQQLFLKNGGTYGGNNVEYRTETFSNNTIISYDTDSNAANGPEYFTVATRDGDIHYYGKRNAAAGNALVKATHNNVNRLWLIERTEDVAGNYIQYQYGQSTSGDEFYLDKILYTGNDNSNPKLVPYNSIDFVYTDELISGYQRTDQTHGYSAGATVAMTKILHHVKVHSDNYHLRTYQLYYQSSSIGQFNQLKAIQECSYLGNCFEPVKFDWSDANPIYAETGMAMTHPPTAGYLKAFDLDGSGKSTLLSLKNGKVYVTRNLVNQIDSGVTLSAQEFSTIKPIDIGADGILDLLSFNGVAWVRWTFNSSSNTFSRSTTQVANTINPNLVFVVDLDGDGRQDLLDLSNDSAKWYRQDPYPISENICGDIPNPSPACFRDTIYHFPASGQSVSFSSGQASSNSTIATNIKNADQSTRFSDFNGDGVTDLIIQSTSVIWDDNSEDLWQNPDNPPTTQTSSGIFAFVFDKEQNRFETYGKVGDPSIENITPYDINGDGLTDVLWAATGVWNYRINRGGELGFSSPVSTSISASVDDVNDRAVILDYDRDGQAELWIYTEVGTFRTYEIYEFNGQNFVYKASVENIPDKPVVVYADLYGKGNTDLIIAEEGTSTWQRWKAPEAPGLQTSSANLITSITSAYGVTTDITYKPLTDTSVYTNTSNKPVYPYIQLTTPMTVVSRVESDTAAFDSNGVEQRVAISYQYQDLRANLVGRGISGFKKLVTTDEQSGIVTETEYKQEFPFTGMPYKTIRKLTDGTVISEATNTWAEKTIGTQRFAYLDLSVEKNWTLESDSTPADLTDNTRTYINQVRTKNTYGDNYGNLTGAEILNTNSEAADGSGGTQWFKTTTVNNFGTSIWEKKYARLKSVSVTKTRSDVTGSEVESSSFVYFDENYNGALGYPGMLKSETSFPTTDKAVLKEYEYDAFGNKVKETIKAKTRDALTLAFATTTSSRSTMTDYDDRGRFVETVSNDLGHAESYTFDPRWGSVATQTGPNGLSTSFKYNEIGMKYETKGIDGTYTREYLYRCGAGGAACPNEGEYYSEKKAYNAADVAMSGYAREFFNKIGQKIVTTSQTMGGKEVVNRIEYDKFGRVEFGYQPIFGTVDSVSSHYTQAKYDALGRLYEEVAPGNRVTTKQYQGLSTTVTNAIGQKVVETKNINGDLLSVTDNANKTMTYTYDSKGQFIKLVDSVGNTITNDLDYAGHKTATHDLDKGTWTYEYNGFGELIRQTDARGVVIVQEYDQLGRMTRRIDNAAVTGHTSRPGIDVQTTCWTYDTAPLGTTGKVVLGALHKVALYAGTIDCKNPGTAVALQEKISGYDNLARAESAMQKLKAEGSNNVETYLVMSTFEEHSSRVEFTILPREVTVKNHYDSYGNLFKITDAADETKIYHKVNDIDHFGNVVDETIGFGPASVASNKQYNPQTGYLESIIAGPQGNELVKLTQGFDKIGNVLTRKDHVANRTEVFDYAEGGSNNLLNRITTFKLHTGFHIEFDQYGEPVPVPDYDIQKTYSYDELGNLKSKSDMGDDYRYGEGTAGVHAVTSIYNLGVKKRTFSYDLNGNMIGDTDHANSANNRVINYAAFEKPVYIKKGTSNPSQITFRYGSGRERYRRIDNVFEGSTPVQIETTYLGAYEKVVHTGGAKNGETEHKYMIGGVALKIDTQTAAGTTTKTKYLHKDHLGSIIAISDHNGDAEQRFRYDPFGKQHQISSVNPFNDFPVTSKLDLTDRGFTGHEMLNSVDIIHMNGRIYDANIGRFMQADAYIQAPKNMQNMNRYSYVLNNPLSYTDPSGHFFKALKKYWRAIAAIAISVFLPGAGFMVGLGNFGTAVVTGAISGAVATGSLKGALSGAFSAGVFFGIGSAFSQANCESCYKEVVDAAGKAKNVLKAGAQIAKIAAHAAAGGVMSRLNGGKFGDGFISAGVTQAFASTIDGIDSANTGFSSQRVFAAAMLGGTVSELTGGKFANGAITAAFSRAFNDEGKEHGNEQNRTVTESDEGIYLAAKDSKSGFQISQEGAVQIFKKVGLSNIPEASSIDEAGILLADDMLTAAVPAQDLISLLEPSPFGKLKTLITGTKIVTNGLKTEAKTYWRDIIDDVSLGMGARASVKYSHLMYRYQELKR